ncbi:MAG: glycosyltransferase family 39 protein [Desulfovibrionaceae bacterium]|nr:glycosyltransferase family 39 protein [Desulfovibrionaceae bacterium]
MPIAWGTSLIDPINTGFHPDEPKISSYIYNFPSYLSAYNDFRQPLLLHNIGGLIFKSFYEFVGFLQNFIALDKPYHEAALIICRLTALSFSVFSIFIVAAIMRHSYGIRPAIFSIAVLNSMPYNIINSSTCWTDIPSSFFILLVFVVIILNKELSPIKSTLALGLASGLGFSTKYTAAIAVFPSMLYILARLRRKAFPYVTIFIITFILAFILTSPLILFKTDRLMESFKSLASWSYEGGFINNLYAIYQSLGVFSCAFLVVSICVAIRKFDFVLLSLLITIFSFILLMYPNIAPRYIILISSAASLVSGIVSYSLFSNINFKRIFITTALIQLSAIPLIISRYSDSRYQLTNYILQHSSPGDTISIGLPPCVDDLSTAYLWPKICSTVCDTTDIYYNPSWVILNFKFSKESLVSQKEYICDNDHGKYDSVLRFENLYSLERVISPPPWPIEFNGSTYYIYKNSHD